MMQILGFDIENVSGIEKLVDNMKEKFFGCVWKFQPFIS